ncbi:hypothetical protein DPMN_019844 [Dreissena polymorpha]|uniref:Uncharacterized protein n=1 Tax=Dreissena polymorpha TaxID=45954 RepID=A0A9D4S7P3_DREPO|nr:hypothetical protein DPMN_019844 [Dreissena polymorpha]
MQSVIGLHATEAVAVIDINVILPDKTWLVILDLTTISTKVTPTIKEGGQYRSSVWLFHFCCSLDHCSNHSHFHLGRIEVSTYPIFGFNSGSAAP